MEINELVEQVHKNAVDHGWWDGQERTIPEILMLCVSELAEALEEYRDGKPGIYCTSKNKACETEMATGTVCINGKEYETPCANCSLPDMKPEGWAVEMADCVIRIMDYFGHKGLDLESVLQVKNAYNVGRPYRHGGKVV